MQTQIEVETKITIVMDREEALWLRSYMQNAMCPQEYDPDIWVEDERDAAMRKKFFDATKIT